MSWREISSISKCIEDILGMQHHQEKKGNLHLWRGATKVVPALLGLEDNEKQLPNQFKTLVMEPMQFKFARNTGQSQQELEVVIEGTLDRWRRMERGP